MDIFWIRKVLPKEISIQNMTPEKNKELHELHIAIEIDLFDKLEAIKSFYGIKNTTEVIRFLITKKYRKINSNKSE